MKTLIRVVAALSALVVATAALAVDPANFDFFGNVPTVPSSHGHALTMYSVINNNGAVPTPLPLDFVGSEHTLVIEATLDHRAGVSQFYMPATVRIYSDAGPATAHDYAHPATFQDGTLILSGTFTSSLVRDQYTQTVGSFAGHIDWTGGTRLGELGGNTAGWTLHGGLSRLACPLPSGFVECWDGAIAQSTVATESQTWGNLKALFK
jgi:hypothetical protein